MKTKMSNALRAKMVAAKKTDEFWMESAKLDFALAIEHQRKRISKSYTDVAAAINTSPAYISKVFRGDANLTIESMVKLTRSLGCNLKLELEEISELEISHPFEIEPTKVTFHKKNHFVTFHAESNGAQLGRFILDSDSLYTNDHSFQNAA